jgi:hypothetical protein
VSRHRLAERRLHRGLITKCVVQRSRAPFVHLATS